MSCLQPNKRLERHRSWALFRAVGRQSLQVVPAVNLGCERRKNSSYDHLRNCYNSPLVPVKLQFFEGITKSLNKFLLVFQRDKPMVAFLAEALEQLLCYFCIKLAKKDVMSRASTASKLIKIDLNDDNNLVSVVNLDFGFGMKYELKQLKSEKNPLIHKRLILKWGLNNF